MYNRVMSLVNLKRSYRLTTLVLVGVASLYLLFAGQATAQSSTNSDVPSAYSDVSTGDVHRDNIARLGEAGVFDGTECAPNKFCPNEPLSRRDFAVWMVRVLDEDQAPVFTDPVVGGQSRFADVEANKPESPFIERLSDLRVTAGCGTKPWRYCPDTSVSRAQMASFFARAFELPWAEGAGFTDVSTSSVHYDNINMLAASKITVGCSSQPKKYCPDHPTTRAQMASFLARALDWRGPQEGTVSEPENPNRPTTTPNPITVTGSDNSMGVQVSYDESKYQANISWRVTTNNPGQVNHYVLQWRPAWSGFTSNLQRDIEVSSAQSGQFQAWVAGSPSLYAVRVVAVRANDSGLASNEIKVPSNSNKLRDLIKEQVIDKYQDEWPWLRETWAYMNGPEFGFGVYEGAGNGLAILDSALAPDGQLRKLQVTGIIFDPKVIKHFDKYDDRPPSGVIHELAHVYTQTSDIADNPAPIGVGSLYFRLLDIEHANNAENPDNCISYELYADMAEIIVTGDQFGPTWSGGYWGSCGLRLDSQTHQEISRDGTAVARSVFQEQRIPDWFYNTYSQTNGDIDLERLWADINKAEYGGRARQAIVYNLRNEFGGYCSTEQVRRFLDGEIAELRNPWRDGGC